MAVTFNDLPPLPRSQKWANKLYVFLKGYLQLSTKIKFYFDRKVGPSGRSELGYSKVQ